MPRRRRYAEKAEYLALVWGTLVMVVTGFLLWFENWTLAHLPKWTSDVATVVHFYEAILASLAILVWHFYFVIFDPLVYPLDTPSSRREPPAASRAHRRDRAEGEGRPRKARKVVRPSAAAAAPPRRRPATRDP
jgi:hypothetical protein